MPASRIRRDRFDALLIDLDGVVTRTAGVHAAAWKQLFDEYLAGRASREGTTFVPFEIERDYRAHVDGKPRYLGVRDFLASRGISLPYGSPEDPPETETICGLGNRKNRYFRERLRRDGAEVIESSVAFIRRATAFGFKVAVVSSSKNTADVLESAGLQDLFDTRVDGVEIERLRLQGKPAPDMFLEAARRLGADPARTVVFEDAVAGVEAGRDGAFGLVVGVAPSDRAGELTDHGADVVVSDLSALTLEPAGLPSALDRFGEIRRALAGRRAAVFLDYDGTLTPIVDRPEQAIMGAPMRSALDRLTRLCPVAVVSGRDRADVQQLVGLAGVIYAGSHGFDISGPDGLQMEHPDAHRHRPALEDAAAELRLRLHDEGGVIVEPKRYAVAVHYRLVKRGRAAAVKEAFGSIAAQHPGLRTTRGKKVLELRPRLRWDKGKAVLWLLRALDLDRPDVLSFYLGDDLTDEDAFAAVRGRGIGIIVAVTPGSTAASYRLPAPEAVHEFLTRLADTLEERSSAAGP